MFLVKYLILFYDYAFILAPPSTVYVKAHKLKQASYMPYVDMRVALI